MRKLYRFALIAVLLGAAGTANAQSMFDEKLRMERVLAERISVMLDKVLGIGKSHVEVVLDVNVQQLKFGAQTGPIKKGADKEDSQDNEQRTHWAWRDVSQKRVTVLPGFSVAPEVVMAKEPSQKKQGDSSAAKNDSAPVTMLTIDRILVSLILDNSVSEKERKLVQSMTSEMLDLNPDRGDRLINYNVPLVPVWKSILFPRSIAYLVGLLVWMLALASLIGLLTWAGTIILRAFGLLPEKSVKPGLLDALVRKASSPEHPQNDDQQEKAMQQARAADEHAVPLLNNPSFDFVSEDKLPVLTDLLVDNTDDVEVSCVLGFMDVRLAGHILEGMPPERRHRLLLSLCSAKTMTQKEIMEVRNSWEERLRNAYGGSDWTGILLSEFPPDFQAEFMRDLKSRSAPIATRIEKSLVTFEDVFRMRSADLQLLWQSVPPKEWAIALNGMPQTFSDKLSKVLPEAALKVFQQWMNLTPAQDEHTRHNAQSLIAKTARVLRSQGKLTIPHQAAAPLKQSLIL